MARAGLISFLDEPGGAPAPAPAAPAPAPAPAPAAGGADDSIMGGDPPASSPAPAPGTPPAPSPAPAPGAAPAPTPAPAASKAPEEYTDFTVPEGVTIDPEAAGAFKTIAKELGLPQEAAQKLVDFQAAEVKKSAELMQARIAEHYADVGGHPDTWAKQCRADAEVGGAEFDQNRAIAAKARDQFGTPALKAVLNKTGAGNHPEVMRFFLRVGQALSEDKLVPGRQGGARKPDTEVFYGTKT